MRHRAELAFCAPVNGSYERLLSALPCRNQSASLRQLHNHKNPFVSCVWPSSAVPAAVAVVAAVRLALARHHRLASAVSFGRTFRASRNRHHLDLTLQPLAKAFLFDLQIVMHLQVQPELPGHLEVAAQP
jgi:hypothetical protein